MLSAASGALEQSDGGRKEGERRVRAQGAGRLAGRKGAFLVNRVYPQHPLSTVFYKRLFPRCMILVPARIGALLGTLNYGVRVHPASITDGSCIVRPKRVRTGCSSGPGGAQQSWAMGHTSGSQAAVPKNSPLGPGTAHWALSPATGPGFRGCTSRNIPQLFQFTELYCFRFSLK